MPVYCIQIFRNLINQLSDTLVEKKKTEKRKEVRKRNLN